MNGLFPAVVASLAGTVILIAAFIYLYTSFRERYLAYWIAGWSVYALRFIFELIALRTGTTPFLTAMFQAVALISGVLLLMGAYWLTGGRPPRWWLWITGVGLLWSIIMSFVGAPFFLIVLFSFLVMGGMHIWTGALILRSRFIQSLGKTVAGVTFIIWGVHKLNFPFLRTVESFAPWGYLIAALLSLVVAISFFSAFFQHAVHTARKAEEELRASDNNYRMLAENIIDVIWRFDLRTMRFTYVSPSIIKLRGITPEEAMRRDLTDSLDDETASQLDHILTMRVEKFNAGDMSQKVKTDRIRQKTSGGQWIDVEITTNLIADDFGRAAEIIGVSRDISTRVRVERELSESEERYRSLFKNNHSVMLLVDPNTGAIVDANPAACGYYGYDFDRLTAMKIMDIDALKPKQPVQGKDKDSSEIRNHFLSRHRLANGHIRDVEVFSGPVTFQGRQLIYSIVHDITDRLKAEDELKLRAFEMETIARVSNTLRSAETEENISRVAVDEILAVIESDSGAMAVYVPEERIFTITYARGTFANPSSPKVFSYNGYLARAVENGEQIVVRHPSQSAQANSAILQSVSSGCGVIFTPVRGTQDVNSVIIVTFPLEKPLGRTRIDLLKTIADIAGSAQQRARLHARTERNLSKISALHEIDILASSSYELKTTLATILDTALKHLETDAADIFLLEASTQMLELALQRGYAHEMYNTIRIPVGSEMVGKAAYERRLVQIDDLRDCDATVFDPKMVADEGFISAFAIPLISRGKVSGVLEVFFRRLYKPDYEWLDFFETLASQAALAVENIRLLESLQKSNTELSSAYNLTIETLSRAMDLRDRDTEDHTRRVAEMSLRLARKLGIPDAQRVQIYRGALLHDIGKMGVPDHILNKTGPLDEEEWQVMRTHPQLAFDMLSPIAYLHPALDIPYCHHEHWDGGGYPRGLSGEQIPLAARIFSVVDVWDALTHNRPYRKAWSHEEACRYIQNASGQQFDPRVVNAFFALLDEETPEVE